MKTAVFLQVRLDSSRLPRKALAKLGDLPLIVRCAQSLDKVRADLRLFVTEPQSVPELKPWTDFCHWGLFSGSKIDVLERFVRAAEAYSVDCIVRATGDNPLVNAVAANRLLDLHRQNSADYSAWQGAVVGTGVEILQTAALVQALNSGADSYEHEHVAPFLYHHEDRFKLNRPLAPSEWSSQESVTVDTQDDLAYVTRVWEAFQGRPPADLEALASWLNAHPR
jgi:spore coat polysaccharide biosynthesis protein SpsF